MRRRLSAAMVPLVLGFSACSRSDAPPAADARASTASTSLVPATPSSEPATTALADTASPIPVAAGGGGAFELYPASQLASVTASLARAGSSGRTIGGHESFHYVESRRVANGSPEIHDDWVDVTLVQAGRATLLVGGRVSGGRLASPGEHRGGTIAGGTPHPLGPGDLLMVPAGIPHQFQVAGGDSVVYLTIKVRRTASAR
jgi:mannose-6-phosphate isomerase-like protein (cupin superfamily)